MGKLSTILGVMLANGMGGHSARGPAFAAALPLLMGKKGKKLSRGYYARAMGAPPMASAAMGLSGKAGLAALGYLAYKAYQDSQKRSAPGGAGHGSTAGRAATPGAPAHPANPLAGLLDRFGLGGLLGDAGGGGGAGRGGLGDRLAGMLRGDTAPDADLGDEKALLLIRAMIAAANADGAVSPDETRRILDSLDAAGAGPEERRTVERELAAPRPMDDIVRGVHDPETAEQIYLASELAVRGGTATDRQYLAYLASRLGLPEERRRELDAVVEASQGGA